MTQVDAVGPDGWVYTRDGGAYSPGQLLRAQKPVPKESAGFGFKTDDEQMGDKLGEISQALKTLEDLGNTDSQYSGKDYPRLLQEVLSAPKPANGFAGQERNNAWSLLQNTLAGIQTAIAEQTRLNGAKPALVPIPALAAIPATTPQKPAPKAPAAKPGLKLAAVLPAIKYRGPEGQTWRGRGLAPRWLSKLPPGKTRDDYLVPPDDGAGEEQGAKTYPRLHRLHPRHRPRLLPKPQHGLASDWPGRPMSATRF